MPRRAKSRFKPVHLIASIAAVLVVAFIGYKLLSHGGGASGGFVGASRAKACWSYVATTTSFGLSSTCVATAGAS
jgi:hypothetical protein